jgi:hypothetical protein
MLPAVRPAQDAVTVCRLNKGSRIISLPGDGATVRGYSAPNLVIVDEAAFIPADNGLWEALFSMVAVSNGSLLLASTPNGHQGLFFDAWSDGSDDRHRVKVTWRDCPRIRLEFIEEQRR